jgi:cell division control protein 45
MYLPRSLISLLYKNLERTRNSSSPPVLLLVSLEPDAICACRILTSLFKRDYIPHNIIPVAGYGDLERAGNQHVQPMRSQNGGSGGTIICLGVGGPADLGELFGFNSTEHGLDSPGGVEIWVIDARRPWNLGNVFGGCSPEEVLGEVNGNARTRQIGVEFGEVKHNYRSGKGGIIVFDDGDIGEELEAEREAYYKLDQMPDIEDDGEESVHSESESDDNDASSGEETGRKRKSWTDAEDEENEDDEPPRQRRRSNSVSTVKLFKLKSLISTGKSNIFTNGPTC